MENNLQQSMADWIVLDRNQHTIHDDKFVSVHCNGSCGTSRESPDDEIRKLVIELAAARARIRLQQHEIETLRFKNNNLCVLRSGNAGPKKDEGPQNTRPTGNSKDGMTTKSYTSTTSLWAHEVKEKIKMRVDELDRFCMQQIRQRQRMMEPTADEIHGGPDGRARPTLGPADAK